MNIQNLLQQCVERRASDLHLSSGTSAMLRLNGDLTPISVDPLSRDEIHLAMMSIMSSTQQSHFKNTLECDFSLEIEGLSRFRVNVFQQARGMSAVFRVIPHCIPSLQSLQAPAVFSELVQRTRGLVLVTGPTGSGKSTTLAAMVHSLNQSEPKHIITIEDPIEFVHTSHQCLIQQREVGAHTHSFANALRAALREDPDVILVGELRDLETIRLAMTAAETGHLVLGTLHTSSAAKSIDRIVDVFPSEEKEMVRSMLSESLNAVISQVLCKRKDGEDRVAAYEVMVGTPAVRNLIREGKVAQLHSVIQTGRAVGMQTMEQSLAALAQHIKS
ncbi:twitching motility protein PilT [Limnohabitans sp. Jir61]|uniref:type IV pilus twitching motility protein PilT n=1 Tax=Limnohabitans sp. Jir61 TaxID=1826168 RepID=UPI000D3416DF|nr:twitching motility protein PilT [Limnohabitans sp. Jir61]